MVHLGPAWLWASALVGTNSVLACVLPVVPREVMPLMWVSQVTMYCYLSHGLVLLYRTEAVTLFMPPVLQPPWAYAAIILLGLGFSVVAVVISSSWICGLSTAGASSPDG